MTAKSSVLIQHVKRVVEFSREGRSIFLAYDTHRPVPKKSVCGPPPSKSGVSDRHISEVIADRVENHGAEVVVEIGVDNQAAHWTQAPFSSGVKMVEDRLVPKGGRHPRVRNFDARFIRDVHMFPFASALQFKHETGRNKQPKYMSQFRETTTEFWVKLAVLFLPKWEDLSKPPNADEVIAELPVDTRSVRDVLYGVGFDRLGDYAAYVRRLISESGVSQNDYETIRTYTVFGVSRCCELADMVKREMPAKPSAYQRIAINLSYCSAMDYVLSDAYAACLVLASKAPEVWVSAGSAHCAHLAGLFGGWMKTPCVADSVSDGEECVRLVRDCVTDWGGVADVESFVAERAREFEGGADARAYIIAANEEALQVPPRPDKYLKEKDDAESSKSNTPVSSTKSKSRSGSPAKSPRKPSPKPASRPKSRVRAKPASPKPGRAKSPKPSPKPGRASSRKPSPKTGRAKSPKPSPKTGRAKSPKPGRARHPARGSGV